MKYLPTPLKKSHMIQSQMKWLLHNLITSTNIDHHNTINCMCKAKIMCQVALLFVYLAIAFLHVNTPMHDRCDQHTAGFWNSPL